MKAQVFSLDMIFSLTVFILIVSFAVFFLLLGKEDFSQKAFSVSEYVVLQKFGYENSWDYDKIKNFSELAYNDMKKTLGISEEIYFRVFNKTDDIIKGGLQPDGKNIANIRRLGLLDNKIVFLDVMLWK